MSHETVGKSNEWYTPPRVFDALGVRFDLDVACPKDRTFICTPADAFFTENALERDWKGFVWMNPPYGNSQTKTIWLNKFFSHGNGIALMPDRTCAVWWHMAFARADAALFTKGRVSFIRANGSVGKGNGTNSCLFASGKQALKALLNAEKSGLGAVSMCGGAA